MNKRSSIIIDSICMREHQHVSDSLSDVGSSLRAKYGGGGVKGNSTLQFNFSSHGVVSECAMEWNVHLVMYMVAFALAGEYSDRWTENDSVLVRPMQGKPDVWVEWAPDNSATGFHRGVHTLLDSGPKPDDDPPAKDATQGSVQAPTPVTGQSKALQAEAKKADSRAAEAQKKYLVDQKKADELQKKADELSKASDTASKQVPP